MSEKFEFRLTHFQERDLEAEAMAQILELVYWPTAKYGISVYGEPSFYKRQNDMGLAFLVTPTSQSEIRIFNTFVDLVRNDRNDRRDRFEAPSFPYSFGIIGRHWAKENENSPKDFLQYAVRFDSETVWRFPESSYDYRYWKKFASLYRAMSCDADHTFFFRAQFDQKFESKTSFSTPPSITDESWRRDRFLSYVRFEIKKLGPQNQWTFTPGIAGNLRNWQASEGSVTYIDWIPHIIWNLPISSSPHSDSWILEYDFTWQRQSGSDGLRSQPGTSDHAEHRVDVSYDIAFLENGFLRLMGTFDPARAFRGKPWGGGNGQFRIDF